MSLHPQQLGNPSGKAATLDIPHPSSQLVAQLEEDAEQPELQSFNEIIKDTQKSAGLFTLYRQKETGKIYLEIKPEQLNKNYFASITMESGIGERGIYSGLPIKDFLFYFRRVNNNLLFTVRNVRYRTRPEDPQRRSVNRSFSDSVLASIPIVSIHPQRKTMLIDLEDLLLRDLPDLNEMLKNSLDAGYFIDRRKSYLDAVKGFPKNVEIDAMYGFSLLDKGSDNLPLRTLPDRRYFNVRVHYSLSELPENNGYSPRLADDRVGYFTTVYQDLSDRNSNSQSVRYINRWNLEKQDSSAPLSPPKKPIVFWIENTVPIEYREAIAQGVLMWNKAFEKAGFKNAIEVRQMPDNATWEPGDVRYNTIRWFASKDADFAESLSRVNPLTGEILDADIIVDANLVRSQRQDYRTLVGNSNLCQGSSGSLLMMARRNHLCYGRTIGNQFAVANLALSLFQERIPNSDDMKKYQDQFLSHLIAHEVGHALGLRHNFRGSTYLKPEELNNTDITRTRGMVSSVMDYAPVNLAPFGIKQGDYFPIKVGIYDEWAIEYGYKDSGIANTQSEKQFLQQIAGKQVDNPELSYAPDEDSMDLDPTANQFDMSSDPLRYSQWQLDNARSMWDRLNKNSIDTDNDDSEMSEMFASVLDYYLRNVGVITKYVGGQSFYRDRTRNSSRLPFEAVSLEKQREALAMLQKYVFAEDAFNFPPELLNKLAPRRWRDENEDEESVRLDYPIHDSVFRIQSLVLKKLLDGDRLKRLRDMELKTPPNEALTIPELFDTLQKGIWTEVMQSQNKTVKISSLRRALQREYLKILIRMVLRTKDVPEDARSLAWEKLRQLRESLNHTLRKQGKNLDDYTKAHLEETRERITKVLDARLESKQNKPQKPRVSRGT